MFIDPKALPQSGTEGPEDWSEAWMKLAGATNEAQSVIENTTSDRDLLTEIYDRRIAKIESLTGTTLANPIRNAPLERRTLYSHIGMPILFSLPRDAYATGESEFDQRARVLAEQYPQVNAVLGESVTDEKNRLMREADAASKKAALSPALDPVSRFTAQMAGGLAGAAKDPFQWQTAAIGAGPSTAGTVAGRIGQTMLTEFLINGGQEAFLQAASQERKKEAGLEYGLDDALMNVGVAGTFGALFGGTVQGGSELARVLKLGEGGAERATRVLEGRPEPGDVEAIAEAAGMPVSPDIAAQLSRSFEERVLDDLTLPENSDADAATLLGAAYRYAEDPDNFPEPSIVQRALADSAGENRTLSADDYERIYGGDEAAIDTYRAAHPDDAPPADLDPIRDQRLRPDEPAEPFDQAAMARAERLAGDLAALGETAAEPKTLFDLIPVEDGDGAVQMMTARDALEFADIPNFHADLLEACQL